MPETSEVKHILYTDQAEYSYVCETCYTQMYDQQWSGSTKGAPNWRKAAQAGLEQHIKDGKDCECCGLHGNGGWGEQTMHGYVYPAAIRRDAKRVAAGWVQWRHCAACEKAMHVVTLAEQNAKKGDLACDCELCGYGNRYVQIRWHLADGTVVE